ACFGLREGRKANHSGRAANFERLTPSHLALDRSPTPPYSPPPFSRKESRNHGQGRRAMRRGSDMLCSGLLAALLAGLALGAADRPGIWVDGLRPYHVPEGPDVVVLEVVLLERPVDDPFVNEELWRSADEQAVPLERKAVLDDNGFRVGQIGGLTPA